MISEKAPRSLKKTLLVCKIDIYIHFKEAEKEFAIVSSLK
jgi:hypothetical protein